MIGDNVFWYLCTRRKVIHLYRAIKLLEQPMKVHECVGNDGQVSIDNMQFNIKQSRRSCTMLLWI